MATPSSASPAIPLQTLSADASNGNAHPPASLSAPKEEDENAQSSVTGTKERWNHPPRNMWKVFAAFISFSVVGANDGSYGVKFWPRFTHLLDLR